MYSLKVAPAICISISLSTSLSVLILWVLTKVFSIFTAGDAEDLTIKDEFENALQRGDSIEEYEFSDQTTDSASLQETDGRLTYFDIKQKCVQESELSFRCLTCRRTYSNFGNFQRHYATAHMPGKRMFPCPFCKREFTRKDNMQAHVRYTHGELPLWQ